MPGPAPRGGPASDAALRQVRSGRLAIWINAAPGAQEAFTASDPEVYFVPPYVGPNGWLGVRLDRGLGTAEVTARIRAAHAATLAAIAAKRGAGRRKG